MLIEVHSELSEERLGLGGMGLKFKQTSVLLFACAKNQQTQCAFKQNALRTLFEYKHTTENNKKNQKVRNVLKNHTVLLFGFLSFQICFLFELVF